MTLIPSGNDLFVDTIGGNFTGIDSFSVAITDSADPNTKDIVVFEVNVASVEDPPVFTTVPVYTDAVVGHAWDYVFSFADADFNQTVSASYDGSVSWLSLDDLNDSWSSKISGSPSVSDIGTTPSITLTLTDSVGEVNTQVFAVQVLSSNAGISIDPGDSLQVVMDEDTSWTLDSNLSVTEANNQRLTWSFHQNPSHGQAELNATNEIIHSLTYFPSADYFGQDSFVIRVSDGIDQDLFTFDFEVQDVPDTPALVDLDNDSVEDGSLYQKTISFSDPDGLSDVTHSISGLPGWVEVHDSNFTNGTITLSVAEVADEGLSQVTVLLTDGNGFQVSKSFSLSVYVLNYPPVFASDTFSITMTEDIPSSWVSPFFGVNDTETLLGNLTWSLSAHPATVRYPWATIRRVMLSTCRTGIFRVRIPLRSWSPIDPRIMTLLRKAHLRL